VLKELSKGQREQATMRGRWVIFNWNRFARELIVGTPQYMSPEQASSLSVGAPADIFAAGTILYEMLTGRRPFEGTSLVEVLYAVLHQNPPPLSGSREIEALDRVIRRAMAKRVKDRYSSARECSRRCTPYYFLAALRLPHAPEPFPALSSYRFAL
jgi:serine/threonine protein kinase